MTGSRFVGPFLHIAAITILIFLGGSSKVLGVDQGSSMKQVQQPKAVLGAKGFVAFIVSNLEAGSPAEQAKLKPGDLITTVNGVQINSTEHIREIIQTPVETPVEIVYWRYNRAILEHEKHQATMIPVSLRTLTDRSSSASRQGQQSKVVVGINGVLAFVITEVEAGSPAERARLKRGDLITSLNAVKVDLDDIEELIQSPPKTPLKITYWRYNYSTYKHKEHRATVHLAP